jgi:hypothetical protein
MNIDNLKFTDKQLLLKQIKCEIKKNQRNRLKELRNLNIIKDENIFLQEVYDDYKEYQDHIVKQKRDHTMKLKNLINYLEKNMLESGLSNRAMRQAKFEQKKLLGKLDNIKKELNELINENNFDYEQDII